VEAADDEPVAGDIGQRKGEALVAARVLERVEPDEPDALDGSTAVRLEDRRARRQLVELATDRKDLVEVRIKDGVEALALLAPGQDRQPPPDAPHLPDEDEDEDNQDEDGKAEAEDDRAEDGLDEGVQVDRSFLRGGDGDRKARRRARV